MKKGQRRKPKRGGVRRKATLGKRGRTFGLAGDAVVAAIFVFWMTSATTGAVSGTLINPGSKLPSAGFIMAIHEIPTGPLPTARPSPDGLYPDIEIPSYYYDFGTVKAEENLEHAFQVANRGEADLLISQFYTTCGCTMARLAAGIIPPG